MTLVLTSMLNLVDYLCLGKGSIILQFVLPEVMWSHSGRTNSLAFLFIYYPRNIFSNVHCYLLKKCYSGNSPWITWCDQVTAICHCLHFAKLDSETFGLHGRRTALIPQGKFLPNFICIWQKKRFFSGTPQSRWNRQVVAYLLSHCLHMCLI